MPPKLKNKEETLKRRRLARILEKRRRYNELKNDPVWLEIEKRKRKERYLKKKETTNQISLSDLKSQRRKWRESSKRYRQKKKEEYMLMEKLLFEKIKPAFVDCDDSNHIDAKASDGKLGDPTPHSSHIQAKERKVCYDELKKRKKLLRIIAEYKRRDKSQRRHIQRLKRKLEEMQAENRARELQLDGENNDCSASDEELETLFPRKINRETCQCEVHVNMELLISALNTASMLNEKNSDQVLSKLCCDPANITCLQRKCDNCRSNHLDYNNELKNKNVTYFQWVKGPEVTITINDIKKIQIMPEKKKVTTSFRKAIAKLENDLMIFFQHTYKIVGQYQTIKDFKKNLNIQECLIHVDFSENCSLKYGEEEQSFHFGGSRQQVSLHTPVAYIHTFDTGLVNPTPMCTISDCLRHDAAAIWAHLVPLIEEVMKLNPLIDTIHFLSGSDSPSTQYRNETMFHIITQICKDFPELNQITWNYYEPGHGEGAPDGVGATVKRLADQMELYGKDVGTFSQFYDLIKRRVKAEQLNIIVRKIDEKDIVLKSNLIPDNIKPFQGTLSVHQVLWEKSQTKITMRKMSCFECSASKICVHGHHLGHIVNRNTNIDDESKKLKILTDVTLKEAESPKSVPKPLTSSFGSKKIIVLPGVTLKATNTQQSQQEFNSTPKKNTKFIIINKKDIKKASVDL